MAKTLLLEYFPLEYDSREILNEVAANPHAPLRVKAILQRADAVNQNGRFYPMELLKREADKYNNEFVKQKRALGECDHPSSTVVELKNVSHNITEMHWEGADLMGTIEIMSTPSGNIVKELMKSGIRLGVSSRGAGSVRETANDTVEVSEDFTLICFDIVSNPSTHGAFLNENKQEQTTNYSVIDKLIYNFFAELK